MLRILGRVSSLNVRKVLWTADELGLAYQREDWGLPLRDPSTPEFTALNPNAQVPVIIDGDFVLWESSAIQRYLARSHDLFPADPRQRARVDQWLGWQASDLNGAWGYAVQALVRRKPGFDDPARIAQSLDAWHHQMTILDGHLASAGPYITGERLTLADIAIGLSVHRWFGTPFDHPSLPAVKTYYDRLMDRPAGRPYLDPHEP